MSIYQSTFALESEGLKEKGFFANRVKMRSKSAIASSKNERDFHMWGILRSLVACPKDI